jgi:hypothetical protein
MSEKISTYEEFWPFYLKEHSQPKTRALHYAGTGAGLLCAAFAVASGHPALLPLALVPSYGAAWAAHFGVEKNRPATFTHPLWSFVSDFRMAGLWCAGKLECEYKKHGLAYRPGE